MKTTKIVFRNAAWMILAFALLAISWNVFHQGQELRRQQSPSAQIDRAQERLNNLPKVKVAPKEEDTPKTITAQTD